MSSPWWRRPRHPDRRGWWQWLPFGLGCASILTAVSLHWPQIPAALGHGWIDGAARSEPAGAPVDPVAKSNAPWRPVENDCSGGVVYFTFDDGPYTNTPTLLDRLDALNLRATFYVIGDRIQGREAILQRELADGHSIQSHTFHHTNLVTGVDVNGVKHQPWGKSQIRADLQRSIDAIVGVGAPRPTQYRPPYGEITAAIDRVAADLGLRLVMSWKTGSAGKIVDSADTEDASTAADIARTVTAGLQDEAIVTMHDGGGEATLNSIIALQSIVDGMNAKRLCSSRDMRPDATGGRLR